MKLSWIIVGAAAGFVTNRYVYTWQRFAGGERAPQVGVPGGRNAMSFNTPTANIIAAAIGGAAGALASSVL